MSHKSAGPPTRVPAKFGLRYSPRYPGGDERPRRGRRHQQGQPAIGIAQVQDGAKGVKGNPKVAPVNRN